MERHFTNTIKTWAIISIVAAHVYIDGGTSIGLVFFEFILNYFGGIGVGLFFITSGFIWGNVGFNLKGTVSNLTIPWIVSGSFIFVYVYVRKNGLDADAFYSYLSFILGQSSYLYYMSVYFIFVLTARIWNDEFIGIILLVVSIIYYTFQIPFLHVYLGINEHLNPLLWFPYVYIGKYAKCILSLIGFIRMRKVLVFIFMVSFILYYYYEYDVNTHIEYLSLFRVFLTFSFFILLYFLYIKFTVVSKFNLVGEQSLFIYLWHMPLIGVLNFIGNSYIMGIHYFSVIIVILFFMIIILFLRNKRSSFFSFIGFRG